MDDALVGRAAQNGMADRCRPAGILEIAADRVAAARRADQRHLGSPRRLQRLGDEGGELARLVLGRRMEGLGLGVLAPRAGIGEVDRQEMVALVAVGLEAPDIVDPQRAGIAIAVHEHDRWRRRVGMGRRGWLRLGRLPLGARHHRRGQHRTARHAQQRASREPRRTSAGDVSPGFHLRNLSPHVGKSGGRKLRLPYDDFVRRQPGRAAGHRAGPRRRAGPAPANARATANPARSPRRPLARSTSTSRASSRASTCR